MLKVVELFAGVGGFRIGLEKTNLNKLFPNTEYHVSSNPFIHSD